MRKQTCRWRPLLRWTVPLAFEGVRYLFSGATSDQVVSDCSGLFPWINSAETFRLWPPRKRKRRLRPAEARAPAQVLMVADS